MGPPRPTRTGRTPTHVTSRSPRATQGPCRTQIPLRSAAAPRAPSRRPARLPAASSTHGGGPLARPRTAQTPRRLRPARLPAPLSLWAAGCRCPLRRLRQLRRRGACAAALAARSHSLLLSTVAAPLPLTKLRTLVRTIGARTRLLTLMPWTLRGLGRTTRGLRRRVVLMRLIRRLQPRLPSPATRTRSRHSSRRTRLPRPPTGARPPPVGAPPLAWRTAPLSWPG